jgi:DDE superfamily endonuclease
MEQVLDLYAQPLSDDEPLVCMDEASKELHANVNTPLPMSPGKPLREDDKYERHGTRAIFMFFAPLLGWRRASSREHRTRTDWAQEIKRLLDEDFPMARKVRLVCDNLNTHHIASLYEAFPAEEAHRLACRLNITYTPRNGSWLNVAEIELSFLSRQCLDRRISDAPTLDHELRIWNTNRNRETSKVTWQFTTADARIKLRHLYPQL